MTPKEAHEKTLRIIEKQRTEDDGVFKELNVLVEQKIEEAIEEGRFSAAIRVPLKHAEQAAARKLLEAWRDWMPRYSKSGNELYLIIEW